MQATDESGITVQVLSATMPGADLLDGEEGIRFAKATNDRLAEAVRQHPHRFAGFAHLPMRTPDAAADELERAVSQLGFRGAMINGSTEGRFLDDSRYAPVLARAVKLDVPVYIHPNLAPQPVFDSYFAGLPGNTGFLLGSGVFGWHAETAIHIFRLALAGTFERHPGLTVIVGHMGEMLPFMLDRADRVLLGHGGQERPISEIILERVYITTSGFFTISPFLSALTSFGADHILFSVDYPFSSNVPGKRWLDNIPVSPADKRKIMHGNADRLLKLVAPA
jgi:predicted TIM-barrel fold metal-dependent hydrolase